MIVLIKLSIIVIQIIVFALQVRFHIKGEYEKVPLCMSIVVLLTVITIAIN